jgi:phage/plasmid primase-like uncharacterized protein
MEWKARLGDDDHKLENNPGRGKALEASMAVNGMVVLPNFTVEQREKRLTDFDELALEHPRLPRTAITGATALKISAPTARRFTYDAYSCFGRK